MADETHLNELVAQEADPAARELLEQFSKMIRDPSINAADYPARLRRAMDGSFKTLTNAPPQPDGK